MIFALIKDGVVQNTIVADQAFVDEHMKGYDAAIEIQDKPGSPGIGWIYDGKEFSAPAPLPPPDPVESFEEKVIRLLNEVKADVVSVTADVTEIKKKVPIDAAAASPGEVIK